jgi:hypothetical protein
MEPRVVRRIAKMEILCVKGVASLVHARRKSCGWECRGVVGDVQVRLAGLGSADQVAV